jgi:hypothetical protein
MSKIMIYESEFTEPSIMQLHDILMVIVQHLDIYSRNVFLRTCKNANKIIIQVRNFDKQTLFGAYERLLKRLYTYPNGMAKSLIKLLREENAVITSDFVLKCIVDDIPNNDLINVFIGCYPDSKFNNMSTVLQVLNEILEINRPKSPFCNSSLHYLDTDNDSYNHLEDIKHIIYLKDNHIKIKFIFITLCTEQTKQYLIEESNPNQKEVSLTEYIKNKFDLSLWKCWFNGYSIESADPEGQFKKVGTMDRSNIFRLELTPNNIFDDNDKIMMENALFYEKMMNNTIATYEEKGFTITRL